jgi:Tol biopolymer transport system component
VTFQSDRDGDPAIFWQLADGTGTAERLTKPDKGTGHVPLSWSPKDETLLFTAVKPPAPNSLWTFSRANRKEELFGGVQTTTVIGAVFSPDGRWVAYSSGEAGRVTVYSWPRRAAMFHIINSGRPTGGNSSTTRVRTGLRLFP